MFFVCCDCYGCSAHPPVLCPYENLFQQSTRASVELPHCAAAPKGSRGAAWSWALAVRLTVCVAARRPSPYSRDAIRVGAARGACRGAWELKILAIGGHPTIIVEQGLRAPVHRRVPHRRNRRAGIAAGGPEVALIRCVLRANEHHHRLKWPCHRRVVYNDRPYVLIIRTITSVDGIPPPTEKSLRYVGIVQPNHLHSQRPSADDEVCIFLTAGVAHTQFFVLGNDCNSAFWWRHARKLDKEHERLRLQYGELPTQSGGLLTICMVVAKQEHPSTFPVLLQERRRAAAVAAAIAVASGWHPGGG